MNGRPAPGPRDRIVVVLEEPRNLVNIAGVVRVMKNFGLTRLRLVRPAEFDAYRIEGIAHRSADIVDATTHHDDIDDALRDVVHIVGTSARLRTAGHNYVRPRQVAPWIVERAREGLVALLFGREDRGLTNRSLDRCHELAIIPTDPQYSSLNLAQACLVLAYEIFLASGAVRGDLPRSRRATRPPTQEELEETYAALESGLARMQFFKAREPEAVMRTLRTVIARARPDLREARLLAAVGYEIRHFIDRMEAGSGTPSAE